MAQDINLMKLKNANQSLIYLNWKPKRSQNFRPLSLSQRLQHTHTHSLTSKWTDEKNDGKWLGKCIDISVISFTCPQNSKLKKEDEPLCRRGQNERWNGKAVHSATLIRDYKLQKLTEIVVASKVIVANSSRETTSHLGPWPNTSFTISWNSALQHTQTLIVIALCWWVSAVILIYSLSCFPFSSHFFCVRTKKKTEQIQKVIEILNSFTSHIMNLELFLFIVGRAWCDSI